MRATRNYIINCRNAPPSIRSDLTLACIFSNEIVWSPNDNAEKSGSLIQIIC